MQRHHNAGIKNAWEIGRMDSWSEESGARKVRGECTMEEKCARPEYGYTYVGKDELREKVVG